MPTLSYRIRNEFVQTHPPREIDVAATDDELLRLKRDGYLVRERLIDGELLASLRAAADELEEEGRRDGNLESKGFGGLFVRGLVDRHPAFHALVHYAPLLSVARATLGPQVQIHGTVLRVAYPDLANQNVEWHFHQRVVPDPLPPFFFRPVVLDNLIYLDDITEDNGPLVVIPGSHEWNEDLPPGDHSDKPGQVMVTVPAGSVVTSHSSLWHKALAPKPTAKRRRLVIFGHSPTWMKPIDRIGGGLSEELLKGANEETRELLQRAGYY
jgi:ectoine hydroxylase-related dioxygenase (phytanoyl-CoA dioxygenase family)